MQMPWRMQLWAGPVEAMLVLAATAVADPASPRLSCLQVEGALMIVILPLAVAWLKQAQWPGPGAAEEPPRQRAAGKAGAQPQAGSQRPGKAPAASRSPAPTSLFGGMSGGSSRCPRALESCDEAPALGSASSGIRSRQEREELVPLRGHSDEAAQGMRERVPIVGMQRLAQSHILPALEGQRGSCESSASTPAAEGPPQLDVEQRLRQASASDGSSPAPHSSLYKTPALLTRRVVSLKVCDV